MAPIRMIFLHRNSPESPKEDESCVWQRAKVGTPYFWQGVEILTVVADLADFDLGTEAWDGIVSISAHVPPRLRQSIHGQVSTALKKGGVFILEAYTERHLEMDGVGGPPPSQKQLFMSLAALRLELGGLHCVVGAEVERNIAEGKYHQGASAVVQLVACKGN